MSPKKKTQKSAKSTTATGKKFKGFTARTRKRYARVTAEVIGDQSEEAFHGRRTCGS